MATHTTALHRRTEGPRLVHSTTKIRRSRPKSRRGKSLLSKTRRRFSNRAHRYNSKLLKSFKNHKIATRSILITTGLLLGTASTVAYMWFRK